MTLPHAMVLLAALLPYLTVALAKGGRSGYDNRRPRAWSSRLDGWRARAEAAHRNHFEAFAPFAAAVLLAERGPDPAWVGPLAAAFVALRVGYTAAYLADRPTLRSVLWFAALGCVVALFWRAG